MNRFLLTVSFPLNVRTMIEDTKEVETVVGRDMDAAGSGFGERDVEFSFPTRAERTAAIVKLLEVPNNQYEIATSYDEDRL